MSQFCVYLVTILVLGVGVWLQWLKWRRRKVTLFSGQICQDAFLQSPSVHQTERRLAIGSGIIALAIFTVFTFTRSVGWHAVIPILVFTILFSPIVCLSVRQWRNALRTVTGMGGIFRPLILWLILAALPVIYLSLNGVRATWQYLSLGFVGLLTIAILAPRGVAVYSINFPVRVFLAAVLLWAPIELGLILGLPLPAHGGIEIARLLIVDLALLMFLIVAPLPDISYSFRLKRRDLVLAGTGFLVVAATALPLGSLIGFLAWSPTAHPWWYSIAMMFVVYIVTAIPEELLFRGVFQNVLEHNWPGRARKTGSLIAAAIIFGATHLNNAPAPNFKFFILATIAGLAYGWVWQKTRKITAAAVTHAMVDWVWITWFLK